MYFSVGEFVALNAMVLLLLASYMKFRRPPARKVTLKMKSDSAYKAPTPHDPMVAVMDPAEAKETISRPPEPGKALNVIFTWNGHSWDAYEVLGLPAGSPMTAVTQAYDRSLKELDESSRGLIQKAYHSIVDKKNVS